jgi:hypothetical protein
MVEVNTLQELLTSEWLPVIRSLESEETGFDVISTHLNMQPHVSRSGYIPLVIGGGEFWVLITTWKICKNGWFKSTIGPSEQRVMDNVLNSPEFSTEEELEDYLDSSDAGVWLKGRCSVSKTDTGWEAEFDAYLCSDNHGRDYISWVSHWGANPDQTIGDFSVIAQQDQFRTEDELRLFLRDVAQQQVNYLTNLRDANPPD